MTTLSEAGQRGGKATQAKLTPEERRRRGRKANRTLGKEGRAARAAKGWKTRRKAELAAVDAEIHALCHTPVVTTSPSASFLIENGSPPHGATICDSFGPSRPKPKRALPKPGTMNARVLEALRSFGELVTRQAIHNRMYASRGAPGGFTTELHLAKGDRPRLDALSSLRTGGHVVSEPMPGSKREKLWRLA